MKKRDKIAIYIRTLTDGHALSSSTCCLGFRGTGFEGDFPKKKDPEMKGAR